ncbi:FtsK/SpoIIIE domain-containing protein [Microbacterium maritypicum]
MTQQITAVPQFDTGSWDETARIAQAIAQKGLQLIGLRADGTAVVSDDVLTLPDAVTPEVIDPSLNDAAALAASARWARKNRVTLTAWDKLMREPTFSTMLPAAHRLRELVSEDQSKDAHEIGVHIEWSAERPGAQRVLMRLPRKADPEKVGPLIPGWSSGWSIDQDTWTGITAFVWGPQRVLPGIVPIRSLMPGAFEPTAWNRIPMGLASDGSEVVWQPQLQPHGLIAGTTGSGKTQGLLALVIGCLTRGWKVSICDPMKGGADYAFLNEFLTARPRTELEGATQLDASQDTAAILKAAYSEGQRRKRLCLEYGVNSWAKLPEDVREREDIRPFLIVIDEYKSLTDRDTVPTMPKGVNDPEMEAEIAELREYDLAKLSISLYTGKIARELRAWGVYIWLALQKAEQDALGKDLRENLPARVQYVIPGQVFAPEVLRFLFPGESSAQAATEISILDDRESQGLGVMTQKDGPTGFRGGFAPDEEHDSFPALLTSMGVPLPRPLPMKAPRPATAAASSGSDSSDRFAGL